MNVCRRTGGASSADGPNRLTGRTTPMIRRSRVGLAGLLLPAILGAVMVGALTTVGGTEARGPATTTVPHVAQAGMVPADCLCGGPGGSADLSHISPWLNSDCNTSISVGTS